MPIKRPDPPRSLKWPKFSGWRTICGALPGISGLQRMKIVSWMRFSSKGWKKDNSNTSIPYQKVEGDVECRGKEDTLGVDIDRLP